MPWPRQGSVRLMAGTPGPWLQLARSSPWCGHRVVPRCGRHHKSCSRLYVVWVAAFALVPWCSRQTGEKSIRYYLRMVILLVCRTVCNVPVQRSATDHTDKNHDLTQWGVLFCRTMKTSHLVQSSATAFQVGTPPDDLAAGLSYGLQTAPGVS